MAELLIKNGIHINATDNDKKTALHKVAVNAIQSKQRKTHHENDKSHTCIHLFGTGNEKIAELLIGTGIDINASDNRGSTAFNIAAEQGTMNVADLLVKAKAKLNEYTFYGLRPYELSVIMGHKEIFEEMLKKNRVKVNHYGNIVNDA